MSKYYNPSRSSRSIFNPSSKEPYRLSRSKIDLFTKCQHCFYLDRKLGIPQPPGYPFTLNSAVDALLKKEFDVHRAAGTAHPLMKAYGLDAVPFKHEKMDKWRDALRGGVEYVDPATNFNITGGVDDIWVNPKGELMVVDYKATAKSTEVNLDAEWQDGYKRQVEVYQWLLHKNGFPVSKTAYFVYANGKLDAKAFDAKLEFDVKIIPYDGDFSWVEPTLVKAKACLMSDEVPKADEDCDFCRYWNEVYKVMVERAATKKKVSLPKKPIEPKEGSLF